MTLLQIAEPEIKISHQKEPIVALGIDLGTTNSLVATIINDKIVLITDTNKEKLIPSVVYYTQNGCVVGFNALAHSTSEPQNTIYSVKRLMGQSIHDIDNKLMFPYKFTQQMSLLEIITDYKTVNPIEVSADILKHLKQLAEDYLKQKISHVVITVPAYFNETQRQATYQAAQLAGLNVLRLLNEPTSAAIAYGLDNKTCGTFLIYDLGGGTLDISILRRENDVFKVLAVNGDNHLGGDDFDHRLYCYILEKESINQLNANDHAKLLNMVKDIKHKLSNNKVAAFHLVLSNKRILNMSITQEDFIAITKHLVQNAIKPIKLALHDAKLNFNDIDEVLLVGGATRMPVIRDELNKIFNCKINISINPDEVVAIGAAIQANILVGNTKQDTLLLDVTPLSLGIEVVGATVEKIIPKNSVIPTIREQIFTTSKDNQTSISIHIVQGESNNINHCRSLAKFSLKNIPPMPAKTPRIRVRFQIDADGLLTVSAFEEISKQSYLIEVKPSYGLTQEQILDMLNDNVNPKEVLSNSNNNKNIN